MIISRRGALAGGLAIVGTLAGPFRADEAWALDGPAIIDCAGWGARPNKDVVQIWNHRPVKILVHHTATPNTEDHSRGAAEALARNIQKFHMDRRGWLDTGQHFTISRGGFVLEGRHRSLEVLRIGERHVEGAHCTGQNDESVGIENEGTYTDVEPTGALWDRLREMCAYICQQYQIKPTEIFGHRDFKNTACPGDVLYGQLPRLRSEVAELLGQPLSVRAAKTASWPLLQAADRGPAVQAAQHMLRATGFTDGPVDGWFGPATAEAARRFEAAHRTEEVSGMLEEVNGMIGGESWPLLVAEAPPDHPDVAGAVQAVSGGRAIRATALGPEEWKQLLTAAAGEA